MEYILQIITSTIEYFIKKPELILLIIMCIMLKRLYPKIRGFFGEFWIKLELKKLPKEYVVLNDILIKVEGKTHQIDHIIVSRYGIFVIETKNYYGLIKGNEYDEKWTQYLGKRKYKFLNPIRQNYGHIKALKELLKIDMNSFISIICFSNQAELDVKTATKVTQLDFLIEEIYPYNKKLVKEDLNKIVETIEKNNIVKQIEKKNHTKNIKNNIKNVERKIKQDVCPKCGGKLFERIGKYGKFIGCSNYPKCKYTKKLEK